MKVVKVQVLPAHDNEVVEAVIIEQTKKGNTWEDTTKSVVTTDTPQATRTLLLDDDDRVIIEGRVEAETVVDREQFTAKKVYKGDKAEEQKKRDEVEAKRFDKMQKDDKEALKKDKPEEYKLLYGEEDKKKAEAEKEPKSGGGAEGQSGSTGKADRETKSAIGPASSEDVKAEPASYKTKK